MSIAIFFGSLLGACFLSYFKNKHLYLLAITFSLLAIIFNWQYFRPEHFYKDVTDEIKLTGTSFIDQQKGSLLDYLPKTALEPREVASKLDNFVNKSNSWELKISVDGKTMVEVPVFDFPGWTVFIDDKKSSHSNKNVLGRISFSVPPGEHVATGKFLNTPIRALGNSITIISLLILGFIYVKKR